MESMNFNALKITDSGVLTAAKWNGLVEKVEKREQELLKTLTVTDGKVGIGNSTPESRLHLKGTGGRDDDLLIESIGIKNSGALIFRKSQAKYQAVQAGNSLGSISFRGYDGKKYLTGSSLIAFARENYDKEANSDLRVYTTFEGARKESLVIKPAGSVRINVQHSSSSEGKNSHGYIEIGSRSPTFAHFHTDRSTFYFNKEIRVESGKIGAFQAPLALCTDGNVQLEIKRSNGEVHFTNKPIVFKEFSFNKSNQSAKESGSDDNYNYILNTKYPFKDYNAAIIGYDVQNLDLQEHGFGREVLAAYKNTSNGMWYIHILLRSQNNQNMKGKIHMMFVHKSISR